MDIERKHTAYRVPAHIAWIDGTDAGMGEELYLTVVPGGQTVLLKDSARLIWLAAVEGGDVLGRVAARSCLSTDAIVTDVEVFLDDLLARGLLALAHPEGWHA